MMKSLPYPLLLLLAALTAAPPALASVEWQARPALKTGSPPLDVAVSADGKWTYVLAEGGKIMVYDRSGSLNDTIEVDPNMDRIAADGDGGRIYLSSRKNGAIYQIDMQYQFDLDYTDSPFLGSATAPVVLAVYSDFQ